MNEKYGEKLVLFYKNLMKIFNLELVLLIEKLEFK